LNPNSICRSGAGLGGRSGAADGAGRAVRAGVGLGPGATRARRAEHRVETLRTIQRPRRRATLRRPEHFRVAVVRRQRHDQRLAPAREQRTLARGWEPRSRTSATWRAAARADGCDGAASAAAGSIPRAASTAVVEATAFARA
jgi:hypothetical protein